MEDKTPSVELGRLVFWAWKLGLLIDKKSSVELRNWDFKRIEHEV